MLYLIGIGLNFVLTQFIVYDDVKNEINSFTEKELIRKINSGKEIVGLNYSTTYNDKGKPICGRININYCKCCKLPECYREQSYNNETYIRLCKPIKLNKIKTGMTFAYKDLLLQFMVSREKELSTWHIDHRLIKRYATTGGFETFSNIISDEVSLNNYINAILEIAPFIQYKLSITMNIQPKVDILDLSRLSELSKNRYMEYKLVNKDEIGGIILGKCNLENFNFMNLINRLDMKNTLKVDFSDSYNDYRGIKSWCNYGDSSSIVSLPDKIKNVIFIFNENMIKFNTSMLEKSKAIQIGYIPSNLTKDNMLKQVDILLSKALLLNKLSMNNKKNYFYVIKK